MSQLGWIVVGIALAAVGGYVIFKLWHRESARRVNENIRAEVDRVLAGGETDANSFVPAAVAGARATITVPATSTEG